MTPEKAPRFLTVAEAAELFRADRRWVYYAASQGVLRGAAVRIGKKLLFERAEVEHLIEKRG